ncbi:MAG: mechanosensitive ion channel [Dehalococcoidia bacterium]|nr:mechanosensitive ion channel [Dehalococcoidia bacterium]
MVELLLIPLIAIDINVDAALDEVLRGGGRILLVFLLALIAVKLIQRLVTPLLRVAIREQMTGEPEIEVMRRIETLSDVIYRTTAAVIAIVAVVTVLPEFGINAGPLIAGLGLVGLAVGFGAQNIVRDVINGIEILMENQYGRGDSVRMRSVTGGLYAGVVEDINLRRTVLRDADGAVHSISHGSIEVATNLTRGSSGLSLTITVAYSADLDKVFEVIDKVGQEVASEPGLGASIRQVPRASGVESVDQASVAVRVEAVTEPGAQWRVASELRRRIKVALDAAGVGVRD